MSERTPSQWIQWGSKVLEHFGFQQVRRNGSEQHCFRASNEEFSAWMMWFIPHSTVFGQHFLLKKQKSLAFMPEKDPDPAFHQVWLVWDSRIGEALLRGGSLIEKMKIRQQFSDDLKLPDPVLPGNSMSSFIHRASQFQDYDESNVNPGVQEDVIPGLDDGEPESEPGSSPRAIDGSSPAGEEPFLKSREDAEEAEGEDFVEGEEDGEPAEIEAGRKAKPHPKAKSRKPRLPKKKTGDKYEKLWEGDDSDTDSGDDEGMQACTEELEAFGPKPNAIYGLPQNDLDAEDGDTTMTSSFIQRASPAMDTGPNVPAVEFDWDISPDELPVERNDVLDAPTRKVSASFLSRALQAGPIVKNFSDPDHEPGAVEREGNARNAFAEKLDLSNDEITKAAKTLGGTLKLSKISNSFPPRTYVGISGLDFVTESGKNISCRFLYESFSKKMALFFHPSPIPGFKQPLEYE